MLRAKKKKKKREREREKERGKSERGGREKICYRDRDGKNLGLKKN